MITNPETRQCLFCGDAYIERHPRQKYCSVDCRYRQLRQVRFEARQAAKAAAAEAAAASN